MGKILTDEEMAKNERERQKEARLIENKRILRRKILMEEYKKSGMSLADAMNAAEVQESDEHYKIMEGAAIKRDAMERAAMERAAAAMERAGGRRKTKRRKTKRRKSKARRKNL